MNELWLKMKNYFTEHGLTENEFADLAYDTVGIAEAIAFYSHRGQHRLNGESYYMHPMRCMVSYKNMLGLDKSNPYRFNEDLLEELCIPFRGVQEVCLLHDVLEDTETPLDEIERLFADFGFESYFNLYIKQPLLLITHDKSEPYPVYINRLLVNPTASLCKLLDLVDNMNLLGLDVLGEKEINRTIGYANYAKTLNDKWHFLEKAITYKNA